MSEEEARPRLFELPPDVLRERAAGYRRMAETARTDAVMAALLKLAERFEELALEKERGGIC